MSMLDPTQQAAFRDLVTALLGNATATQENTKAITDLTGSNAQSFSSSFWTGFRVGALHRRRRAAAAVRDDDPRSGDRRARADLGRAHGPRRRDRPSGRHQPQWQENAGDVYHLNVTTPTQVLDPTDVGRQLAFRRSVSALVSGSTAPRSSRRLQRRRALLRQAPGTRSPCESRRPCWTSGRRTSAPASA
jgi:hypothetical protein